MRLVGPVFLKANDEWQLQHRKLLIEAFAKLNMVDQATSSLLRRQQLAGPCTAYGRSRDAAWPSLFPLLRWMCPRFRYAADFHR
jgi:hypothetical protein